MKKAMAIFLSAVMMIVMLTGCIHQDMGVKLNKDGTGAVTTTLGIEKDFYDNLKEMGSDPFEGKTVTEYEYDGSTYVACTETKEYASYEDLEKALLELTYETELIEGAQEDDSVTDDTEPTEDGIFDVVIDEDAATTPVEAEAKNDNHIFYSVRIEKKRELFRTTYSFNAQLNPQNADAVDYDPNETFNVTLSVEMPAEITEAKGGDAEGNKVVFDITDITEKQELTAASEVSHTGVVIGIIAAVVAFAALTVGLIYISKHKK